MVGPPPAVPVNFNERAKRIADEDVRARYGPRDPNAAGRGGRGGGPGGGGPGGRGGPATPPPAGHLTAQQVNQRITAFLRDNMPALRLIAQGGGRIPGVIVAQNGAGQIYDDSTPQPPAVILRTDDYGRIFRIIADGTPVTVEFNVSNQFFPAGKTSYITVAEIPGTDKADEVVMLGGHLDSWASATGATDNAIGCAIMMEAARILQTTGAKPRRTIRVALWSGEEEGEYGSFAYVKDHFGSAEAPTKEFAKLDAYWNIDDGTGRVHGASIFGPPEAGEILAQYFKPFEDFGVFGASASTARVEGGSDNGAFDVAGLPGIGAQQGSDRIQQHHLAHEPRHVRADRARRCDAQRRAHRIADDSPREPRPDAAALCAGQNAAGSAGSRRGRRCWSGRHLAAGDDAAHIRGRKGKAVDGARARRALRRRPRGRRWRDRGHCDEAGAREGRTQRGRRLCVHTDGRVRRDGQLHLRSGGRGDRRTRKGDGRREVTIGAVKSARAQR